MLSDRSDASRGRHCRFYIPRQQLLDAVDRVIGDALKHEAEIRLSMEDVQASRANEAVHCGCALAAGFGADEQEVAPPEGHAAQRPVRDQVVDLCPTVCAAADECRPAIQSVTDGFGRV